ncbi:MAG: arsenosugar biosynthesis radical SAM (seleno)protein ArsS [Syntrophobacteraceae bacterium]
MGCCNSKLNACDSDNSVSTRGPMRVEPFSAMLARNGLELCRGTTRILQINTGLLCDQFCAHCHLEAGPRRSELMGSEVMEEVIRYAERGGFDVVDITGGAPELNPSIEKLLTGLSEFAPRIVFRSNLTALNIPGGSLAGLLRRLRAVITAPLPPTETPNPMESRALGVLESVTALRHLNELGYGMPGAGLDLNLVHNPPGPVLPPPQARLEEEFRSGLRMKWGIEFNNLYSLANAPLGRFKKSLERAGGFEEYMCTLASAFNPAALDGVMCRELVSVSWDGYLFDCDFNLAAGVPLGGRPVHVSEMEGPPAPGSRVAVSDHCHACTAGAGFT